MLATFKRCWPKVEDRELVETLAETRAVALETATSSRALEAILAGFAADVLASVPSSLEKGGHENLRTTIEVVIAGHPK